MGRYFPQSDILIGKTQAQRFFVLRDAILLHVKRMRANERFGTRRVDCGPFRIEWAHPGVYGRPMWNTQIWPGRVACEGHFLLDDKVANVDWDFHGTVELLHYRSGRWEDELLSLLDGGRNVAFISAWAN